MKDATSKTYRIAGTKGGSAVQLLANDTDETNLFSTSHKKVNQRGVIKGFSRRSRKRLLFKLASINKDRLETPLLITLTYGKEVTASDWRESKNHLRALFARWKRKYDEQIFAFWRIELQKSGRLHYHIVLFGLNFLCGKKLRSQWSEIVGVTSRVEVQKAKSWKNLRGYFSKTLAYVAKQDEGKNDLEIGRHWGVFNKKVFKQFVDQVCVAVDRQVFYRVRRLLHKLRFSHYRSKWKKWKVYARKVKKWTFDDPCRRLEFFCEFETLQRILGLNGFCRNFDDVSTEV